ncbi:hypothetical protein HYFRA_00000216 [Hymenoscyphus fraxineus]|uniref:NFX1-type zinc finger-containing protein 1 n=1 Tax=Hymenoscyphus fraxineus TaxID=746836 RepID=A0A9N9PSC7_9HELO|nr:hypothetical protein HYFRA_00000216 [Hymenoscyphus fraxineus]
MSDSKRGIGFTQKSGNGDRGFDRRSHRGGEARGGRGRGGRGRGRGGGQRGQTGPNTAPTQEEEQDKKNYNAWKRLIKNPPSSNETWVIQRLWTGALEILNGSDREWKQMLPRDLDSEEYHGRQHILTVMSMKSGIGGSAAFLNLAQPFLSVITHPGLLDCLSVDTFVGSLYNFISGTHGKRVVDFLQRISECLNDAYTKSHISKPSAETILLAMIAALYEISRREQRAAFNDDLPGLLKSIEEAGTVVEADQHSFFFNSFHEKVTQIRAIVARAHGLLADTDAAPAGGVSTTAPKSTFPRQMIIPGGNHDNDDADISKIKILPTDDEIGNEAPEFLPSTDLNHQHFLENSILRHLDTQFRLLRHDIFGDLKSALGGLLHAFKEDPKLLDNTKLNLKGMRAYVYPRAHVSYLSFHEKRGIQASLSFHQLPQLRKKSASERRKWWQESKRLEEGALLCFVAINKSKLSFLFLVISERTIETKSPHGLVSNEKFGTIVAKLATLNQTDLELLTLLSCGKTQGALIEFPGVLLATFVPILENLQDMHQGGRLPFRQWILPDISRAAAVQNVVPPPLYARKPGFSFSLKSIAKCKDGDLSIFPNDPINYNEMLDKMESQTSLDRGQCEALLAALMREFAFIQGPPGTGKSYVGVQLVRVLLDCIEKAKLGPIVVVCYTNHALDQFLEHLIEAGIEKVIRIGGQSKSEALDGKNLRVVAQGLDKTKSERYLLAKTYEELEENKSHIERTLRTLVELKKSDKSSMIRNHLTGRYPHIHTLFDRVDEEGFELVGKDPFEIWLQGVAQDTRQTTLTDRELLHVVNQTPPQLNSLSNSERHRLVAIWLQEIHDSNTDELFELVKSSDDLLKNLQNIHDEADRRVLKQADIIGVTTTGLARRISVLRRVKCKIVICEEAGEVMESHILSTLLPSVEHFIQIGDHQQLSHPQINNYNLSLESKQGSLYQLDRSQFERLSVGEFGRAPLPVAQLRIQRRMRPEISRLIRSIYPRLIDDPTTMNLPDVIGMRNNVFWLDHDHPEATPNIDRHQTSHSNDWEVDMTHALVRHIVRQGAYKSSDIAVLTPYTGQLQKLRAKLRTDFEIVLSDRDQETLAKDGFVQDTEESQNHLANADTQKRTLQKRNLSEFLRLATVDNFQGEESKVIIISLVRSNNENRVGFLRTTNRINVLLSRAQHGMYLLGNSATYSIVPMWADVLGILGADHSVGKAFSLCCPRHLDTVLLVSSPLDFEHDVIQIACTQHSTVQKTASAYMIFAATAARKHAGRIVDHVCTRLKFHASKMLSPKNSIAQLHVTQSYNVVIYAQAVVEHVMAQTKTTILSLNTGLARKFVEGHMEHAIIVVEQDATMVRTADFVRRRVLFSVHILGVHSSVTKLALLVLNPKTENRVDFLEMKSYGEIDVNETPIVVLGCGHFFTAESLDGIMNMSEVYEQDMHGEFTALKDVSPTFSAAVPSCPDCKCPIRQFATQRYNRVINRAVIDEISRRFLTAGKDEIRQFEKDVPKLEKRFDDSLKTILNIICDPPTVSKPDPHANLAIERRYNDAHSLEKRVKSFCTRITYSSQPARKLHDATIQAARKASAVMTAEQRIESLSLTETPPEFAREHRITLGAFSVLTRIRFVVLRDKFTLSQALEKSSSENSLKIPGKTTGELALTFLKNCQKFIKDCMAENLPKMAVEATLFYATIARLFEADCRTKDTDLKEAHKFTNTAKELLKQASELCKLEFQNAESLGVAVQDSLRILRRQWYEEVTPEELESIKKAMVSGPGGIATHSGHW